MTRNTHLPAAKKPAPLKRGVKKPVTKKKSVHAKIAPKVKSKPTVHHNKLAIQALKFLDEATALLRTGIREGAETTEESRILAKRKAHSLLGKASKTLSQAIEDGASTLQDFIKKM
jgi:hypothetical protein